MGSNKVMRVFDAEKGLEGLKKKFPCIVDVRGMGLMFGVEVKGDIGPKIFQKCLEHGLIINCTQGNVLRIMPALIVTKKQIDQAIFILER